MIALEVSDVTIRVRCQTYGDAVIPIIHSNIAGIARPLTDTVLGSSTAVVLAVLVAMLTDTVVVGIFFDRTLRLTVRTILHILTAYARVSRLIRKTPQWHVHYDNKKA